MRSILFFDEHDATTTLRVGGEASGSGAITHVDASLSAAEDAWHTPNAFIYSSFAHSGSLPMPEVRGSLLWWLDQRPRPRGGASGYLLHLLAVGDGESAAEARAGDARLLSIDVPIYPTAGRGDVGGEQLLTCGLTRLAKAEHCVAATWLSSSLVAGFLRVTVQRAQERLILVPEGHIITFANPLRLPGGVVAEDEDQLSACVVGALPPRRENSAEDLASVVVITNGQHLWRALLHLDGRTRVELIREDGEVKERVGAAVDTLRRQPHPPGYAMLAGVEAGGDHPQQREASASYTAPTSSFGGRWLSRVLGRRGEGGSGTSGDGAGHHIPARRYLSLCAVHNSHYVVLLRWNGLLEVYDGTGESWMEATSYPSCPLPQNILAGLATSAEEGADGVEAAPTIQQWAAMDERRHDLHIVSCIGRGEGRRCTWAVMPLLAASTEQRVGLRHVLDLAPPTLASSPMSCSIAHSGKSLLLLWDLGMEEDAHLLCPHTLASLNAPIPLALAQVVTVRQTTQEAEVRWEHTQTNLSRGGRYSYLRAALTHEDHFVVVERHKDYHRAHALVCSATPDTAAITTTLDALTTTVLLLDEVSAAEPNLAVLGLAGGAGEVQSGGASPPSVVDAAAPVRTQHNQHLPALAWVPTVDGEARQRRHDTPALRPFWEGLEVLRACPSGTSLIAELVEQVMQHAAPLGQLPALPRILCEARLSGWSPEFTTASAADVELAMMLAIRTECATLPPFCRFDRHAILHLVCRELHHRILFLLITYLGWMSGAAAHINDGATQDLGRLIERWVAAYHTARVCGPDLVNALAANPSDEHLVGSIVGALVEMHPHHSDDEEEASPRTTTTACTRHALGVAQRLWVSGSPRNAKAAVMWATYLANTHPLLHHYILLSDLHAGRTARAAAVHVRALHVSLELAKLSPREAVEVLLSDGILLTEAGAGQQPSTMGLVPRSEWELLLMQDANMASAVYLVGLFRYLLRRSGDVLMDGNTARRFLMVELTQLRTKVDGIHKRGGGAPSLATLQHALLELHVEALLGLARYSAEDGDVGPCFHDLQSAVALMDEARSTNHPITANLGRYTEAIQLTVRALVERSFQMPSLTNALVHLSCDIAAINSMLVHQWHQCIAALPTKSASERTEAIRTRAILGLHRFLLARHAYAQCGRVLTNLASLLRCSPRRQGDASRYLSVAELCSMAVSAVELITPAAAVRTQDDGSSAGASPTTTNASPNSAVGFSWMDLHNNTGAGSGASSLCGAEANNTSSTSRRLLSREDLPWLRLRAYQAHCEERLWSLGGTLDCADIWIEGASADNYARGITKLIHALVGVRLWQEAFELAQLAAVDVGAVAEAWAVWLVEQRRGSGSTATTIRGPHPGAEKDDDGEGDDEKDDSMEWEMLLDLCRDACGAPGDARRFDVLRRVAVAACVRDFANTPQTVMESVYEMDPYTAIAALLHAFEVLLHRRHPHAGRHDDDEEAALLRDNDVLVATPSCWLVWAAAAGLAVRALTAKQQSALTAGLVDPLARYGHEALRRDDASRISAKDQAIIDSAAHNLLKAISSISA